MKVLIIGGTNRTAINVAKELQLNGYFIEGMTYRDKNKIVESFNNWMHLDFFDDNSVNKFLINQESKKYDKIILFISNSTQISNKNLNYQRDSLKNFYGIFCVNYLLLINNLLKCLSSTGSIIFISSSAVETGCNDPIYSSGKALVQSYITSLNNFLTDKQSALSLSPGTIFDSNFYESLPSDSPIKNDINAMTYPKEIAEIIINAYNYRGKTIKVGWGKNW